MQVWVELLPTEFQAWQRREQESQGWAGLTPCLSLQGAAAFWLIKPFQPLSEKSQHFAGCSLPSLNKVKPNPN